MSGRYDINIEYIKATDSVKQVCLRLKSSESDSELKIVYILDDDTSRLSDVVWLSNKNKDYARFLQNMYNSADVYYKSALYQKDPSLRKNDTFDYKNIFLHRLELPCRDVAQVENTLYSITEPSRYGHAEIDVDSNKYLALNNGIAYLPLNDISTFTYDKSKMESHLEDNTLDLKDLSSYIKDTYVGVKYSLILEIPGTVYNYRWSGNIAANALKCKNLYTTQYDMISGNTTIGGTSHSCQLKNTRTYIQLDNCNDQVYLKYYDSEYYEKDTSYLSSNDQPTQLSAVDLTNDTPKQSVTHSHIQNIETIDYISRFANEYSHKSNLYSVNVDVINRYNETLSDNEKAILSSNIKSFVKKIASKIMPAHTQLFDVYVS